MIRICFVLLMLVGLAGPGVGRAQQQAVPEGRLFAETGWRVRGRLLEYWEQSGALPVFGLPLGPQRQEQTGEGRFAAQVFERERLELHPELRAPFDVLLGRLGDELLRRQGRDWRNESGAGAPLPGDCQSFATTGRTVCGAFLSYWRGHGLELGDPGVSERESLALFGLPLTAPRVETNSSGDRVLTQWFERARFEYHPSNPPAARVLLGRLGAELAGEPAPLPTIVVRTTPGAVPQGRTVTIGVTLAEAIAVRGSLGDAPLAFFPAQGGWTALGGVPVLAAPGSLPLRIEADLPDGRTAAREQPLPVLDARYRTENINLPPDVQKRLDENRETIAAERRLVNAIWPQVTPDRLWQGRFILPTEGRISSAFGTRRSYNGGPVDSFHEGLDIANAVGTPVVAPARGRVMLAEPDLLVRGGAVILDHGQGVHTGFWHMSAVLVTPGQLVEQGQIIGRIGAKGMVTGPHLHWDVRIGMVNVSPLEWTERELP